MTTSINREALLKALALVRPALATQDFIPALTHVRFDGEYAMTYNDISAISVACGVDIKRCVPGDLLIRALGSFGGSTVALAYDEAKSTLLLSSGRSKLKLPTLAGSAFPFELPSDNAPELMLDKHIVRGIERCLISVGSDPTHPEQMGVTLEADTDGHAVLFSTDNFSISRYQTKSKVELPGDAPIILPTFFCEQIVALSRQFSEEEARLTIFPTSLLIEFGLAAAVFTKTLVDLTPVDFPKVIKRHVVSPASVELSKIPDAFDAAFQRQLLVLANEVDKTTKVETDYTGVSLFSTSAMGDADDDIEMKLTKEVQFLVDPALVVRGLKTCTKVGFYPKVMILADDDGSFLHLIAHCNV